MAGLISSAMSDFPKMMPRAPQPVYYVPTNCSDLQTSFKVDYNPKVSETSGRSRSEFEAFLNSFKAPELKPSPFYPQQDKIIYYRGPLYNDTYHLDVSNVSVGKHSMPGNMPLTHDEYKSLRRTNLINPGRPMEINSGVYYNTKIGDNRPSVSTFNTKNPIPNNGGSIPKFTTIGRFEPNRNAELPINIVPSLHQPSTTPYFAINKQVPYRRIPQDQNIIDTPLPRINAGMAVYSRN
jgi:hypothetical protein